LIFFIRRFPIVQQGHLFLYTEGGMNLRDALRHAEQQGKNQVRRGAEKLHNVEAAIRRKVHDHLSAPGSMYPDPEQERENLPPGKVRTGIVSVNGHDIGEMRCTGGRKQS
jgi:hypothetical protein